MEDKSPILIDNGTAYCKAGFTGEEQPKVFLKTCVGYPKHSSGDFFIGADIDAKKGVLELNYPMKRGQIINFDDMEKIWSYIFTKELKVDPAEYNVMLTNAPMNPINKKEKITNIMFETFNVLGFYLALPHTLALYSAGIFTGIVADLGEGVNSFCPIFDGYPLHQAMKCFDFSGKDLTDYMIILLNEKGQKWKISWD